MFVLEEDREQGRTLMELLELEMRARYEKITEIIRGRNFCVGYLAKPGNGVEHQFFPCDTC